MIHDLLATSLRALRRLDGSDDLDDKRAAADDVVDGHLALGLALARAPELRWEGEMTDFLYDSAPLVARNATFLAAHVDNTRRLLGLPFDGEDDWGRVCARRSAFEFLRALYEESEAADALAAIDLAEVDERLRFVGAREGQRGEGAPDDVPVTHWWWWLPGDPPDASEEGAS